MSTAKLPGNTGKPDNYFLDAFDESKQLSKADEALAKQNRSEPKRAFDQWKALEDSQAFGRSRRLDAAKKLFPELLGYIKSEYPDYSLDQQLAAVAALAQLAAL